MNGKLERAPEDPGTFRSFHDGDRDEIRGCEAASAKTEQHQRESFSFPSSVSLPYFVPCYDPPLSLTACAHHATPRAPSACLIHTPDSASVSQSPYRTPPCHNRLESVQNREITLRAGRVQDIKAPVHLVMRKPPGVLTNPLTFRTSSATTPSRQTMPASSGRESGAVCLEFLRCVITPIDCSTASPRIDNVDRVRGSSSLYSMQCA